MSVHVDCPACGEDVVLRPKTLSSTDSYFNLNEVPEAILKDIAGQGVHSCGQCNAAIMIDPFEPAVWRVEWERSHDKN